VRGAQAVLLREARSPRRLRPRGRRFQLRTPPRLRAAVSRLASHALIIACALALAALAYWQGCAHGTRAERARWEERTEASRGEADSLRAVAAAHVDAAAEWERLALLLADSLSVQRDRKSVG